MATYLEIKELLAEIFLIEDIDESCDIVLYKASKRKDDIVVKDSDLRELYEKVILYSNDKLEMYNSKCREVAVQISKPILRMSGYREPLIDPDNDLTYVLGPASLEYCVFLLTIIADYKKDFGAKVLIDLRHRSQSVLRQLMYTSKGNSEGEILAEVLRAYSLRIDSKKDVEISILKRFAESFEFMFIYKQNMAISECTNIYEIIPFLNTIMRNRVQRKDVDTPPRRLYNKDVLDYYTMAMESRDPFTTYISYYHVVEHYFDEVYRRKLTEEIKNRLTYPGFSYKDEKCIYELAKYIRKHMRNDDISGKGNEYDSLRYVLSEYVPINELRERIDFLDPTALDYYNAESVPFVKKNKSTKISWSDIAGVYTSMSTRIYETRNALVHSKSEQKENQYRPYENQNDLTRELALIRAVAELVIVNTSDILE